MASSRPFSVRRLAPADLQAIIDAGRDDVPLIHLRYRCAACGSQLTDSVVAAKSGGRPAATR